MNLMARLEAYYVWLKLILCVLQGNGHKEATPVNPTLFKQQKKSFGKAPRFQRLPRETSKLCCTSSQTL